jgi:thiamine kinase-like enzyme
MSLKREVSHREALERHLWYDWGISQQQEEQKPETEAKKSWDHTDSHEQIHEHTQD